MVKGKIQSGHTVSKPKRRNSDVPTKHDLRDFKEHCIGDVCFNDEGKLVVDLSKTAEDCPVDLREKIVNHYLKGGEITFKMPVAKGKED